MFNPAELNRWIQAHLPGALEFLREMVAINSWTRNPAGVNELARLTAGHFAPLGFSAESVPSANCDCGDHLLLTRRGSTAKSLALVSHLDTVFPPEEEARNNFHWQPEGDRIFGPGTHDIKGGTAMMWLVLAALREHAPAIFESVTWRLFLDSSEETSSFDFGELCRQRCDADTLAALVFEAEGRSEGVRRLVIARKGRATWRVSVAGRGAHAGSRHPRGANAIVQLGQTLQRVAALTDYSRDLTVNIGTVGGGNGLNRVPHEAWAEGELRAFKPEVFAKAKADLLALDGPGEVRSGEDGFACEVCVEILSESRPWPRNAGTDALMALWQSTGEELGEKLRGEERGGLSDGNLLWDALPTIDGLGPWGDNDHCSERSADGSKQPEYVEISSFVPKAAVNTLAIARLIEAGGVRQ